MKPVKDRPFYAQFMNKTGGQDGVATTKKAGPKGNDVDGDSDAGVGAGGPIMTTMKAGPKGNDVDGDSDTGVDAGGPIQTTKKAGPKGNDVDSDSDGFDSGGSRPIMTTKKAGPKGNDVDGDTDVGTGAEQVKQRAGVSALALRAGKKVSDE